MIASVLSNKVRRVVAIENEPAALSLLRRNLANQANVEILDRDFMSLSLPSDDYAVFANIPFHLSSSIVRKLTLSTKPPQIMYLIVQKQFADKLLIERSNFIGSLGATIAPWFTVRVLASLKRSDYTPPPNVDTVFIEVRPRLNPPLDSSFKQKFAEFIDKAYGDLGYFKKLPLETAGLDTGSRPSRLSLTQWLILFNSRD